LKVLIYVKRRNGEEEQVADAITEYKCRFDRSTKQISSIQKRIKRISNIRFAIFIVISIGAVLLYRSNEYTFLTKKLLRVQVVGQNTVVGTDTRYFKAGDTVGTWGKATSADGAGADIVFALPSSLPAGGTAWLDIINLSTESGLNVDILRKVTTGGSTYWSSLTTPTIPKRNTTAGSAVDGKSLLINGLLAGDGLAVRLKNDMAVTVNTSAIVVCRVA
jgi:hypothetical protein